MVKYLIIILVSLVLIWVFFFSKNNNINYNNRISKVANTDGLIAFWDFTHLSSTGKWTSYYDNNVNDKSYDINLRRIGDNNSYNVENWPYQNDKSRLMFDKTGPFGHAIRFNQGYVFGAIPRTVFGDTPLNINSRQPFTIIAWAKFIGYRHFVAGIWDEGGWDKYRGRRQYALFGGLFNSRGVIGHISTTGASSYPQSTIDGSQYARVRAIDGNSFDDHEWVSMAMTFDPESNEVMVYQDGIATESFIVDPVEMSVYQFNEGISSNPYYFKWPIFSPEAFTIKYNGYNVNSSGVYEHWIYVDLNNNSINYGRKEAETSVSGFNKGYKVKFDIFRNNKSLLSDPVEFITKSGAKSHWSNNIIIYVGDIIKTSLYQLEKDNKWEKVGTTIEYSIREGAPFTFGRALGLGDEPIDYGTQLYLDGVAVFNRVLNSDELSILNF